MYKVIIICGKAGSGKDTLLKKLNEDYHRVVSTTTRPPREGEVDGKDYHFISVKDFHKKVKEGKFLEYSLFNDWWYGTQISDFEEDKINVFIANPDGIRTLLEKENFQVKIYYLIVSKKTRLLRQLNREKNPNVDEIIRRYQADEKDFDPYLKENKWIKQSTFLFNENGQDNSCLVTFD